MQSTTNRGPGHAGGGDHILLRTAIISLELVDDTKGILYKAGVALYEICSVVVVYKY